VCGRYSQTAELETLQKRFRFTVSRAAPRRRYNIAPAQTAPVILRDDELVMDGLRWGLVPSWAKDPGIGAKLINARSETVQEKPSFRTSFSARRCLVPADGFYEWAKGPSKTPYRFTRRDGRPFAFAGLWDRWQGAEGAERKTFTILTTEANPLVRKVHHRMPVILREDDEPLWMDPKTSPEALVELLLPCSADEMRRFEVSARVNSTANDDPACAEPVETAQPELGL